MREQFFIECRGYFGKKDRVTVVLKELMLLRKPGVHRMPRFVGKSEHVGKHIRFVVHQNIRRIAVAGGGERSASFSLCFVAIDPTGAQPVSERLDVLGAERMERLNDEIDGLIEIDIALNLRDQRYERVVLVNVFQLQKFTAEVVVLVEDREIFPNRRNQVVVHRDGDVVPE